MSARFSADGKYRWVLRRVIEPDLSKYGGKIVFCGVNPSDAGSVRNDPSVVRMINFTALWCFGELAVVNPFSAISSTPDKLAEMPDPVGGETDYWLRREFNDCDLIVPMWGAIEKVPPHLRYRFDDARRLMRESSTQCKVFGLTKQGHPQHPLYLPRDTKLKEWTP